MKDNFNNFDLQAKRANSQIPRQTYQQWQSQKRPTSAKYYEQKAWEPSKSIVKNTMTILVKKGQRGNPILKKAPFFIKYEDELKKDERGINGFPYSSEEMAEDYLVNKGISVLFLSLAYHKTYPQYICTRLSTLFNRKKESKRILLLKHDCDDPNNVINCIYIQCSIYNTTCLLCWSDLEAAQYLHTFKTYESKGDSLLQGKNEANSINRKLLQEWGGDQNMSQSGMTQEILASIRRINKKDAKNLMENYGSVKNIVNCQNYNEFVQIDGIGQSKVESLTSVFRGPFDPEYKIYRKKEEEQK